MWLKKAVGMEVVTVPYEQLNDVNKQYVTEGYPWGCQCGESYKTQEEAENCRKCRTYLTEAPTKVYFTPYGA